MESVFHTGTLPTSWVGVFGGANDNTEQGVGFGAQRGPRRPDRGMEAAGAGQIPAYHSSPRSSPDPLVATPEGVEALHDLEAHQVFGLLVAELALDAKPQRRAVLDRQSPVADLAAFRGMAASPNRLPTSR